ncbi:GH116 family glycosyl hydrolase [Actinophytocola sediminis]
MTTASDHHDSTVDCCADGTCCPPAGHNRRAFLAAGMAGLGALAAPAPVAAALGLDPDGLVVVPADKNLTRERLAALVDRGRPTEYTGEALARIGMPVGGGCGGQVYLAGDGRLWAWDILNPATFPLGGATAAGPHYAEPLTPSSPFPLGFTLRTTSGRATTSHTIDADGFADVRFVGQYPVGTVTYRAPDCPLEITATAYAPFIPLAVDDSTLPATTVTFTLRNTTGAAVRAELVASSANPVCLTTRDQQPTELRAGQLRARQLRGVEFSAVAGTTPGSTDIVFEDWEAGTFDGWTVTGDAFGAGPVTQQEVPGYVRRFGDLLLSGSRYATSHNHRAGGDPDSYQGTLTSREFTVERRYVAVGIGGGGLPGEVGVEVLVDDAVVANATGRFGEPMVAATLDLGEHLGRTARIRIADRASVPWAHVNCDTIVFTDRPDILFEDWEAGTFDGWTVTGDAFGAGPVTPAQTPPDFRRPVGEITDLNVVGSRFVTSYNFRAGGDPDAYQGKLTSREFTVERRYLTMWVGGGAHPGRTCVNLVVDGEAVASMTGREMEPLTAMSVDVSRWAGRTARLEVVDSIAAGWGHVNVGRIMFGDRPVRRQPIETLPEFGTFALAATHPDAVVATEGGESGTVTVPLTVQPGQSGTVRFLLGWHFPIPQPAAFGWLRDGQRLRHHYATRFASAGEVVTHLAAELPRLTGGTETWVRTWYQDSTLPHWFLERTLSTVSTLATNTCFRFDNGRFYAWEGIYCCAGTCGHVWNYAQSVARLFPELERDTRERVDLGIALRDNGEIGNRGEADEGWFADGQCGTILRVYREHQMSPDDTFLRGVWPAVKKALAWVISADGDGDGILDGGQWNTLDAQWFGEIPWISGLYVAALHAGAAMATELGDSALADRYTGIADRGSAYLDSALWNAEYGYFFQKVDPAHPDAPNSNRGCHIDQLYAQTYAGQLGLPRVFSPEKSRTALTSLFRNNFLPDAGSYRAPGIPGARVYAMPGEAGTVMCTWPHGGSTEAGDGFVVGYFNEVWTGQEYQFAAHLIAEGMVDEGLAVTRAVHDRHDANRRNPYNEIECSDHYARAMMSYGVYLAACGYEYHGPRGHIGFAPRLTPERFAAAFTGAEGWGLYRQTRQDGRQECVLELRYGRLRVRTLAFEAAGPVASVRVNGGAAEFAVTGLRVLITLREPVTVQTGASLSVDLT